jgi:hypothetical protein
VLLAGEVRGTFRCFEEQLLLGLRERQERPPRHPAAVREVHRHELRLLRDIMRRACPSAALTAEREDNTRELPQQYWGLYVHRDEQVARSSRWSDNLEGQLDFRLRLCAMRGDIVFAWQQRSISI